MKILITICARGGSKGIPGKNIKMLNGKPLIYYSLKVADMYSKTRDTHVVLSTDSEEIKNTVKALNFNVDTEYERPAALASDGSGKLDAIADVLNYAKKVNQTDYDYVIDLDVTSPLRTVEDIENAFKILSNHETAYNLFSVSPANRNPYFNMVEESEEGFYRLCKQGRFLSRQSAPKVYDLNASFYIYKAVFFEKKLRGAITDKSLIYEVPHICFDLDHPIDFDFMEYLLANDKLDFKFI